MSRLVVVSNRVTDPDKPQTGGLATALGAALTERGGIWFGWSGNTVPDTSDRQEQRVQRDGVTYATIDLTQTELNEYYGGFANRVLWPLFHYRLDLVEYHRQTYATYQDVNRLFADKLVDFIEPDDIVWIHDYHLIPLAHHLRRLGVRNRIGFFLHTPLAAEELLRTLPCHRELLGALQYCDLVGLQSSEDLRALREYYNQTLGARISPQGTITMPDGRYFDADVFPISIDTAAITEYARRAGGLATLQRMRSSLSGRALMIGVDRLDYSKGLPGRFQAFAEMLEQHPDLRGRVTLLQIAPPSRSDVPEYQKLREELEQTAGHINGAYAEPDWIPIRYVNKSFSQALLAGFYRMAQVAAITPLRDGMNLVAKEYVACQDPDNPGVLILSRFAGAAAELDAALRVNPYDQDEMADAMARALQMSLSERRNRWESMIEQLQGNDINHWREAFLRRLSERKLTLAHASGPIAAQQSAT